MSHVGENTWKKKQGHGDACECPQLLRTGALELPGQVRSLPKTPAPIIRDPESPEGGYLVPQPPPACLLIPRSFGLPKQLLSQPGGLPLAPNPRCPLLPAPPALQKMLGSRVLLRNHLLKSIGRKPAPEVRNLNLGTQPGMGGGGTLWHGKSGQGATLGQSSGLTF